MVSQDFMTSIVNGLVVFATDLLIPFMAAVFFLGVVFRFLIHFTVKREEWFSREFEKRVHQFIDEDDHTKTQSFFVLTKKLLEKTFYEVFEIRSIMKRRRPDYVMDLGDRVFLIKHGVARMVKDTLKQIKYLKEADGRPELLKISKKVHQTNPCFNKVFGIIPASSLNDLLSILPGLFIIGGIFGTFLGIMKALPGLGDMDLTDPEMTKQIMDEFLLKISFSMSTSIVGIILSVGMNLFNTLLSPEKLFVQTVDRFENALHILWSRSSHNELPAEIPEFDEDKDALEALASEAVSKELRKDLTTKKANRRGIPLDHQTAQEKEPKDEDSDNKLAS
jgi:hypothetical protein